MVRRTSWLPGLVVLLLGAAGSSLVVPPCAPVQAAPAAPAVAIDEFLLPLQDSAPDGITAGPDGNLWFTETAGNRIGRITPAGMITEFPLPATGRGPTRIVTGADHNLWATEFETGQIARITPAGAVTQFALPTQDAHPISIAAGADGNLWFAEYAADQIGRITPGGAITEFRVPTASSGLTDITAGPDGNLWFTAQAAGQVGRITTAGVVTEFPLPSKTSFPTGITTGPDGNLWVCEVGHDLIAQIAPSGRVLAEYALPNQGSSPEEITTGPDGNLWLPLNPGYINLIGRLTVTGTVTTYAVPTENSTPLGITTGPDGNLWFTERTAGRIGRISEVGFDGHCPVHFADVPAASPFYAPVRCLACHGMLAGYADGTFRPGAPLTRGQFAKLLGNAADYGEPVPPGYQTFADVPPAQPFYRYVERVAAHFVLRGYACGGPGEPCDAQQRPYFRPGALVPRGDVVQAVALAGRFHEAIPPGQQTFRDVAPGSALWLAVERAARRAVVSGYADGTFRPTVLVTRSQAAKMLAAAFLPGCVPPP